jgi:DNA-binding MarR family transcriptional regulator
VLAVTATGTAVYREVAPLALGYERELLATLGAAERAALDRALDALTTRAQALSEARVALRQRRPRVARRG